VCTFGMYNSLAVSENDCMPCFCFGITSECSSSELFLSEVSDSIVIRDM